MITIDSTLKKSLAKQRSTIVLWRKPITTLIYFTLEVVHEIRRLTYG